MKKLFVLLLVLFLCGTVFATPGFLQVTAYSYKPTTVYPNDTINLNISLKNNSTSYTAENIIVTLPVSDPFFPIIDEQTFEKISPSETKTVVFTFKAKETASPGTYTSSVIYEYYRGIEDFRGSSQISLNIAEDYRIEISEIDISNRMPHIGEVTDIDVLVRNTGSLTARNVTLTLSRTGTSTFDDFILLSKTEVAVGDLKVDGFKWVEFKLKAGNDIEPAVYSFDINASCTGCASQAKEKLTLSVLGKPNLIFSGIDFSVEGRSEKKIIQGDTVSISINLDNIGKEQAKAVEVVLETPDSITGSKIQYVGSIDADDSGAAIFDLTVLPTAAVGDTEILIKLNYIDELDEPQTITKEHSIYINPAPFPVTTILSILIALAVVLVIAYFFVKMYFRQMTMRKA